MKDLIEKSQKKKEPAEKEKAASESTGSKIVNTTLAIIFYPILKLFARKGGSWNP